ncbi:MAG: hypothetical protein ACE14P_15040 [Methanotrichaceae archaeon]
MDRELLYLAASALAAIVASIIVLAGIISYVGLDGDSGSHIALNENTLLEHSTDIQNIITDRKDTGTSYFSSNKSLKDICGIYPVLC